ncbi:DUF2306 domain-containing protein [Chelativorans sp. ZYF759]|uniref:DUF2306 domain-containing protein n=1 Tax=Chelativorans sp. ZYF759 TaxID=2692213 RepID=UPI00145D0E9F|nr:DUF2306 domain-containing protein [Chelativorans sp. ZYF759]NMG40951.1 DUF2306 domain-containing protein [Chelativorans sp. ZYF759]
MTLQPLLDATVAIQIHTVSAILAFVLGGLVLFRRKGDRLHRMGGRIWAGLMGLVCVSSFFIHTVQVIGIWSPIHVLSVTTLAALIGGIRSARAGSILEHQRIMQWTYFGALILAGYFTFLPGRIMYRMVFGGFETAYVPLAVGIAAAIGILYWWLRLAASGKTQVS